MKSLHLRLSSLILDLLILTGLAVWLWGGIWIGGHHYLRHGADPRRAAIILGILGFLYPPMRTSSVILRGVLAVGAQLSQPVFRWGIYWALGIGACCLAVAQAYALRVTLYDVGIFHQILWSISHGLGFHSSISGAGNFLLDHLSPALALLTPAFQASENSPLFLPVAHSLLLWMGGAAWIFLASRVPGIGLEFRRRLAAAATVFVLSFDSLWGNQRWGFHENVIGFVSLSWAMALILSLDYEGNWIRGGWRKALAFGLLLITAGSKEIFLPNIGLVMMAWAFVEWRQSRENSEGKGLSLRQWIFPGFLVIQSGILIWAFIQFEKLAHPADKNYFNRYYSYLGQNLTDFAKTLIFSPQVIIQNVGWEELGRYFLTVFLPWLFLPLVGWLGARRFVPSRYQSIWLIGILPSLASAALATYSPLRGTNFHYVLELWPILATLTILILAHRRSTAWMWAWAVVSLLRMDHDPIADFREYQNQIPLAASIRTKLREIPAEASLVADEHAGTWVANRQWVTRWPDTHLIPGRCPDYIVVRYSESGTLTELGVRAMITQCRNPSKASSINSDMIVQSPTWRIGDWSGYRVRK